MSVAQLTARDFSLFLAVAIRSGNAKPEQLADLYAVCENVSLGNVAAFRDSYGDSIPPVTADEIETATLSLLADKSNPLTDTFPGLRYNCVSQRGTWFYGMLEAPEGSPGYETLLSMRELESKLWEWQKNESRRIARQADDDAAYSVVGPLDTLTRAEIAAKCVAAGCARVIIATYHVDESESMTDYFGGRTSRAVVIGFGKGKRENFLQLRAAAGEFEPTQNFGPGRGEFTVYREFAETVHADGTYYHKGTTSRWHDDEKKTFNTRADADAYAATLEPVVQIQLGQRNGEPVTATLSLDISEREAEHRENYSMGGGNYLGWSRYGGWKVTSEPLSYFGTSGEMEYFERVRKVGEPVTAPIPKQPRPEPKPIQFVPHYRKPEGDTFLAGDDGYCRLFHKSEVAQKEIDKLTRKGYGVEMVNARGAWSRPAFMVKLISEPVPATVSAPIEPAHATASAPVMGNPITSEVLYRIEKHYHEKRGADIYICVPTTHLPYDRYNAELERARAVGGWQSRKFGSSPSGFGFETMEAAKAYAGAPSAQPHATASAPYSVDSSGAMVLACTARVRVLADRVKARAGAEASHAWFIAKLESIEHAMMETAPRWFPALYPVATVERHSVSTFDKSHATASAPTESPEMVALAKQTAQADILADKLRTLADGLTETIEQKTAPLSQNWTPKRGREHSSRVRDGRRWERVQRALYALADAHERGDVPPVLQSIRSKKAVWELVGLAMGRNDRTGEVYDMDEPASHTPEAVALRQLVENKTTDADRAKREADKQAEAIRQKVNGLRGADVPGFFPTPEPLAARMVDELQLFEGATVLEPSAGIGSLCEAVRDAEPSAKIQAVEIRPSLCEVLRLKGFDVVEDDFTEIAKRANARNGWGRVIMNPPFEKGQDIDHVRAAYACLAPGGRLVALMSSGSFHRSDRKSQDFREWLDTVELFQVEEIESGAFTGAEAFRQTGVSCRLVVIDAPGTQTHATRSAPIEQTHATPSAPEIYSEDFSSWL